MNEISKKIIISVTITAIISGSAVYLVMAGKAANKPNISSEIAVGKPCDARDLKSYNGGGNIQDTKGLQCYMYDDLSYRSIHNGIWTYPNNQERERGGVWIYPNQMSETTFLTSSLFDTISLPGLTQDWKSHNNNSKYSFIYPSQWEVEKDEANPNELIIRETNASGVSDAPLHLATITFYPNTKFEMSENFRVIKEAPADWLLADTSSDSFVYTRHFDLNGTPALLVARMGNFDLGNSPYQMTVYVPKTDSYYAITYTKYHDSSIDIPVELMIKSLRFK